MTEPRSYLDVLPEITRRILAASNPEKIVLFGSYARGDFGPDSDLRRSLRGLLVPVDILVATPEQVERHRNTIGLIYRSALAEGEILYERRTAA
jgi:predicted nucleotidyltransferase